MMRLGQWAAGALFGPAEPPPPGPSATAGTVAEAFADRAIDAPGRLPLWALNLPDGARIEYFPPPACPHAPHTPRQAMPEQPVSEGAAPPAAPALFAAPAAPSAPVSLPPVMALAPAEPRAVARFTRLTGSAYVPPLSPVPESPPQPGVLPPGPPQINLAAVPEPVVPPFHNLPRVRTPRPEVDLSRPGPRRPRRAEHDLSADPAQRPAPVAATTRGNRPPPEPPRPEKVIWRRKSMVVRAVLGTVLGASIVACAMLSPAAVVVPLLAVGLWVWFEMRHADSKRRVRAGHAAPGRRNGGQGPQSNGRDAPPYDNARPERHRRSPRNANEHADRADRARPPAHRPPPEIPPGAVRRTSLEQQLLDWQQANPQNRTLIYQRLRNNLRNQSRALDLTAEPVSQLPDCMSRFRHLEEVRLRPHVLRDSRFTDGPMPAGGHGQLDLGYVRENLRAWVFLSGGTAEQARFLERHFRKGSAHIDLRGLNLPSIPDVLASYPSLNSVSVSPRLLQRVSGR